VIADRFDALYERYCDGTLEAAEREEFLRLLQDPAGRARFAELSVFAALVTDELGVARAAARPARSIRRRARAGRPGLTPWLTGGFAAAAALLMVLFAGRSPAPPPPKPAEARRPDPPPVVAPVPAVPDVAPPSRREERAPEPLVVPPPRPAPRTNPSDPVIPPAPPPPPPPGPPPFVPADPPKPSSVAAIAVVEAVAGKVSVSTATTCLDVAAGHPLCGDENIETGDAGAARIRFNDGTRVSLGADTMLARITEARGKSVRLDRGVIGVEAVKQAQPMVVAGPHAEAVVLGTEFTFAVSLGFTRLDVREGLVRFSRGGVFENVKAGQYAVARPGHGIQVKAASAAWKAPPVDLLLWLRGDAIEAGARGVSCWEDLSGMGNHASQPQAGCQPKAVDGPRPSIKFDGQGDHLELPSIGLSQFRGGLSAYVVARAAGGSGPGAFLDLGAGPSCDNVSFGRRDGSLVFWAYANGQTRGRIEAPGLVAVDQWAVYGVVALPSGQATLFRHGAPPVAGATSPLFGEARKSNFVGKSHAPGEAGFRGEIAEVLLYQRVLGEEERARIEAYLWAKYLDPSLPPPLPRLR
jgi:ferric-dicitrate binding protein FerR (iron transport regulator)